MVVGKPTHIARDVTVRAIQVTADGNNVNAEEIAAFLGEHRAQVEPRRVPGPGRSISPGVSVTTLLGGTIYVRAGGWVIDKDDGTVRKVSDETFKALYESLASYGKKTPAQPRET